MRASGDGRMRKRRGDGPIRFRTSFRNTIYDVLRERPGWIEASTGDDASVGGHTAAAHGDWDFQWAERDQVYDTFDTVHLDPWQRMNHYRNGRELCRKDLLAKNIKRSRRTLEKEGKGEEGGKYDFAPITFILPGDYALFVEEFKRHAHSGATWIMKPIARSQGKGIFLFNKLAQIQQWKSDYRWKPENAAVEAYVVQKYLANPYLIGGKKFDLRVYALVTSFAPLTVWIYRSGFTRFSASRYSNDAYDSFVHLTNVAVQKTSADYNPELGGKWELSRLKSYLTFRHGFDATNKLFGDIQDILLYALFSVSKIIINDVHCFELYGYDILIDDVLKPWLLEVNASPSMTASTRDDYDLKYKLLNDTLDVVDMEGRLTGTEEHIGGFDLVWRDGPVVPRGGSEAFIGGAGLAGAIASPTTLAPVIGGGSVHTCMMGAEFDRHLNLFRVPGRVAGAATRDATTAATATGAVASSASAAAATPVAAATAPAPSSTGTVAASSTATRAGGTSLPPAAGAAASSGGAPAMAGSAALARRSSSFARTGVTLPAATGAASASSRPSSVHSVRDGAAAEDRGRSSAADADSMPALAAPPRTRPTMSAHHSRHPNGTAAAGAAPASSIGIAAGFRSAVGGPSRAS